MHTITPALYATPINGSLNYAVYDRSGSGRARRVGTIKRRRTKYVYCPSRSKVCGALFDTLAECLRSLGDEPPAAPLMNIDTSDQYNPLDQPAATSATDAAGSASPAAAQYTAQTSLAIQLRAAAEVMRERVEVVSDRPARSSLHGQITHIEAFACEVEAAPAVYLEPQAGSLPEPAVPEPVREQPRCPYCGSNDVACDGTASWDDDAQEWVLAGTFDGGHCRACERDLKHFEWREGVSDTRAVDGIRELLDGMEWSAATCSDVADIVRATGRVIRDVDSEEG